MTGEAEREVVVPEPGGRWRRILPLAGILWVLVHVAIPLRYYRGGGDRYDERFAWRMFSAVRVQQCTGGVFEVRHGVERPLPLMEILPAPWVALLERNRPSVVERFLRWRCEREGVSRVRFRNACNDASGDPLPVIERTIDCATGRIEDSGGAHTEASADGAGADRGSADGSANREAEER